jgi:hypothetical protein
MRARERTPSIAAAADAAAPASGDAGDYDAHAFLTSVYRDPTQPIDVRMDAAKAAIRFEKALAAKGGAADFDPTQAARSAELVERSKGIWPKSLSVSER